MPLRRDVAIKLGAHPAPPPSFTVEREVRASRRPLGRDVGSARAQRRARGCEGRRGAKVSVGAILPVPLL